MLQPHDRKYDSGTNSFSVLIGYQNKIRTNLNHNSSDVPFHVPEGAIPKDGPSAGLCMATALISALTKRSVNRDVAMTGEITLTGRALPIGGLKEKTLAAHRGGIKKVLFPKGNIKDLEDIPESIKKSIKIIAVSHMDEVLLHTLIWKNITNKKTKDELYHKLMKKSDSNSIFLQ